MADSSKSMNALTAVNFIPMTCTCLIQHQLLASAAVLLQVGNGMKAGQKITKVVQKQVKEVVRADAKIGKAVAKATDKAINAGEKAVVIGIGEKLSDLSNILTGPSKGHHGGSAAKEVVKTIKAVEHGKQKAAKAFEKAAEERQHAIKKATKQISSTIDHTHSANNKALKGAGRAINKAFLGRP